MHLLDLVSAVSWYVVLTGFLKSPPWAPLRRCSASLAPGTYSLAPRMERFKEWLILMACISHARQGWHVGSRSSRGAGPGHSSGEPPRDSKAQTGYSRSIVWFFQVLRIGMVSGLVLRVNKWTTHGVTEESFIIPAQRSFRAFITNHWYNFRQNLM